MKAKRIKKLHIYCRTATEIQEGCNTLSIQAESGIKYAEANGFKYEIFSHIGKGMKDNSNFEKLFSMCRSGLVTDIFVVDWDRISRSSIETFFIIEVLRVLKVKLHNMNGPLKESTVELEVLYRESNLRCLENNQFYPLVITY